MANDYDITARNIGVDAIAALGTRWAAHTADPGGANSATAEVSGGSPAYARKAVAWNAASGGTATQNGDVVLDIPAGTTVTYVSLWNTAGHRPLPQEGRHVRGVRCPGHLHDQGHDLHPRPQRRIGASHHGRRPRRSSESHTGTTGVASVASFTWNHVPTGTPRSALVFTFAIGANPVTGRHLRRRGDDRRPVHRLRLRHGARVRPGVVPRQRGGRDEGRRRLRTNNAVVTYATCMTQTAAKACEVYLRWRQDAGRAAPRADRGIVERDRDCVRLASCPWTTARRAPTRHPLHGDALGGCVHAAAPPAPRRSTAGAHRLRPLRLLHLPRDDARAGRAERRIARPAPTTSRVIALAVREVPVDNRNANVTATGGGIATEVGTQGRHPGEPGHRRRGPGDRFDWRSQHGVAATGSGIAAPALAGAHVRSVVATGGGVAVASTRKAAAQAAVATGGGVASLSVKSARSLAALLSGGGGSRTSDHLEASAVTTAAARPSSRRAPPRTTTPASPPAPAAARRSIAAAHQLAVAMTGGGAAVLGVTSSHCAFLEATGAGVAIVDGRGQPARQLPGLAAAVRILAASAGEPEIAGAPAMSVVSVSDAPVITSARFIP